jgi:hypothetical protein
VDKHIIILGMVSHWTGSEVSSFFTSVLSLPLDKRDVAEVALTGNGVLGSKGGLPSCSKDPKGGSLKLFTLTNAFKSVCSSVAAYCVVNCRIMLFFSAWYFGFDFSCVDGEASSYSCFGST